MNRLFEFIQHNALLTSAAALLAIVAVVIEFRHRLGAALAVGSADAVRLMNSGALVVDVRTADAFAAGLIIDARHIPQAELASQAEALKKYREKAVLVYCESGQSSGASAGMLKALGFTNVVNLRGGVAAWKQDNMPLVTAATAATASASNKSTRKNKGTK